MVGFSLLRTYAAFAPSERGGFRLARAARRLLRPDRYTGPFQTGQGVVMELDLATYPDVAMAAGMYELDTQRLIRELLRPGMHFVDGGANIGFFSTRAAKQVGAEGRVDAFEPDPENRARLQANLARNGLADRVQVHPEALAEAAETVQFHRPAAGTRRNHGESSRFPKGDVPTESYSVQTVRLDEAIPEPPDLVKLDLEGSELLAVRGATDWLKQRRAPAWIIEHNPGVDAVSGYRLGDVWRELLEHRPGYQCWFIGAWLRPIDSPEQLDEFPRQGNVLFRLTG